MPARDKGAPMLRTLVLVGAVLFAGAAAAQTRTCENTIYGMPELGVSCHTNAPTPAIEPRTVEPKPCSFFERQLMQIGENLCEPRAVAAQRRAIDDMLAADRCDDAVQAAL